MNADYKSWFLKAENDMLNVTNNLASAIIPTDTVCYHCQQAAEKYLKGFLTYKEQPFEKVHNLLLLLQKCIEIDDDFSSVNDIVAILNLYGPSIRYPDFIEEPTLEEAYEAFQLALQIKSFVETKLDKKN